MALPSEQSFAPWLCVFMMLYGLCTLYSVNVVVSDKEKGDRRALRQYELHHRFYPQIVAIISFYTFGKHKSVYQLLECLPFHFDAGSVAASAALPTNHFFCLAVCVWDAVAAERERCDAYAKQWYPSCNCHCRKFCIAKANEQFFGDRRTHGVDASDPLCTVIVNRSIKSNSLMNGQKFCLIVGENGTRDSPYLMRTLKFYDNMSVCASYVSYV